MHDTALWYMHAPPCCRIYLPKHLGTTMPAHQQPPSISLPLSVALPLTAPALGQPCTSIDNNSQAQKTAYFQYDVVSITVILPYPPHILTPSRLPSKRIWAALMVCGSWKGCACETSSVCCIRSSLTMRCKSSIFFLGLENTCLVDKVVYSSL